MADVNDSIIYHFVIDGVKVDLELKKEDLIKAFQSPEALELYIAVMHVKLIENFKKAVLFEYLEREFFNDD